MAKTAKPRKVSYELIPRETVVGHPMYTLLDELVSEHHPDLAQARIALAWCTSWKPDADGNCTIGKCKRAGDLDRELAAFDFIILLLRSFWRHESVTDTQRRALLDHELCHAAVKYDSKGEPVEDERGRRVYRTRKHDVEEFVDIVRRYGTYKRDLETFATALRAGGLPAFKGCEKCADRPGWVTIRAGSLVEPPTVKRCDCWHEWQQIIAEVAV